MASDSLEVDVQAKKKFDSAIAEARGRLATLEQEQRRLGEEEAKLRAEGEKIKTKLVRSLLFFY
jgi:predicted nuclease with TOPRIM domain